MGGATVTVGNAVVRAEYVCVWASELRWIRKN